VEGASSYRLRVVIGELVEMFQEGHWVGKFSYGSPRNAIAGQPRKISCGRSLICSTVLGTNLEIKVDNCPCVSLWSQVGVSSKLPANGVEVWS
jgi:hypothetical protein